MALLAGGRRDFPTLENPQVPIDPYGPFTPLFTFGDSSGYLGPGMVSRLSDDFEEFDQAADESPERDYHYYLYLDFLTALRRIDDTVNGRGFLQYS